MLSVLAALLSIAKAIFYTWFIAEAVASIANCVGSIIEKERRAKQTATTIE